MFAPAARVMATGATWLICTCHLSPPLALAASQSCVMTSVAGVPDEMFPTDENSCVSVAAAAS